MSKRLTAREALARAEAIDPAAKTFVVRLYDNTDKLWIDVTRTLNATQIVQAWNRATKHATRNTNPGDGDFYAIFPHTVILIFRDGATHGDQLPAVFIGKDDLLQLSAGGTVNGRHNGKTFKLDGDHIKLTEILHATASTHMVLATINAGTTYRLIIEER